MLDGNENAYVLHKELGEWMTDNVTVVRENKKLLETDAKIEELMERVTNALTLTIQQDGVTKVLHLHANLQICSS